MTKALTNYDKIKISTAHVFLQYNQATMIHKYSLDYNSDWLYIALLPLDEEGQNHDGEVYLYSFTRTAEGAPMLSNIESDEEYNKAAIAFDTVLQNAREAEAAGTPLE